MPTPKIGRPVADVVQPGEDVVVTATLNPGDSPLGRLTKNLGDRIMILTDALQKAPDPRQVGGPPVYWRWYDEVRKLALDQAGRLSAAEGCLAVLAWGAVMGWVVFGLVPYLQTGLAAGFTEALTRTLTK